MKSKIVVGALSMLLAGSVLAQAKFPDEGFYGFAIAGKTTSYTSAVWNGDSRNTWNIGAGYDFNKYVGFEAGYWNMSNLKVAVDTNTGTAYAEEKMAGLQWSLVGKLPINDTFKLRASIGKMYGNGVWKQSGPGVPTQDSGTQHTTWNRFSIGGEMGLDRRSALRLEYFRTGNNRPPGSSTTFYEAGFVGGINVRF